MKLVDVNKLQKIEIDHERYDYVRGCMEGYNTCIEDLETVPEVKAIPIEWIEKWIAYWERILPDWGAFQVCAAMLKDWEKENEISVMPVSDNSTIPLDYLGERK